jgi:hypothetical protein
LAEAVKLTFGPPSESVNVTGMIADPESGGATTKTMPVTGVLNWVRVSLSGFNGCTLPKLLVPIVVLVTTIDEGALCACWNVPSE